VSLLVRCSDMENAREKRARSGVSTGYSRLESEVQYLMVDQLLRKGSGLHHPLIKTENYYQPIQAFFVAILF